MSHELRKRASAVLGIGLLAVGCGGKVLEAENMIDSGAGHGGAGMASGGSSAGGAAQGGYGQGGDGRGGEPEMGGYGQGGHAQGGYGQGGNPGIGGAAGATSACVNPQDTAVIQAIYDGGTMEDLVSACAKNCLADMNTLKDCASECVQQSAGGELSDGCADCYGASIECGFSYCLAECAADFHHWACILCRCGQNSANVNCAYASSQCSGIHDVNDLCMEK